MEAKFIWLPMIKTADTGTVRESRENLTKCSTLEQLMELTSTVVEELANWTSVVAEEWANWASAVAQELAKLTSDVAKELVD